jgi:hypothetical protein
MNGVVGREIGRSSRSRALVVFVAIALLSACSGSGFQYVRQPQFNAIFKLPEDWRVLEEDELRDETGLTTAESGTQAQSVVWMRGFTGTPGSGGLELNGESQPAGLSRIRVLTDPQERSEFNMDSLRNEFIALELLGGKNPQFEVLNESELQLENGLHGIRLIYQVRRSDGSFTYNKTALVDPYTRVIFLFLIGCSSNCYEHNKDLIDEVVSSYKIGGSRGG